jgi:hypothetical protein
MHVHRTIAALGVGLAVSLVGWSASTIAQDGRQTVAAPRIATVDVLGLVERMLAGDRYRPAQEEFLRQENDRLRPLADELEAMERRGRTLPPGSPELENLGREFDRKQEEFQEARAAAFARIEAYNAGQVREAYRQVMEAIDAMAAELGYTHVIASRTGDPTIRSQNVPGALQEILARPVAKASPADDLTERLIRKFGLENVKLDDPAEAGPGLPDRAPPPPRQ